MVILTVIAVIGMGMILGSDVSDAATYSGECGDGLTWTVDTETETLTISGDGTRMTDYDDNPGLITPRPAPWKQYGDSIYFVNFECANLEYIGNYAFNEMPYVASIYLSHLPLKEIGFRAFYSTGTVHLNLPDSVVTIGAGAFQDCSELIDVTFGSDLEYIGNYAFANPSPYIDLITLPDSLTFIGVGAFDGWRMSEKLITLPDNTVQIMDNAFRNTSGCTTVVIPKDFKLAPGSNNSFVGMNPVNIYNGSEYVLEIGSSVCGHIAENSSKTVFIQQTNSGRLDTDLSWAFIPSTGELRITGYATATPDFSILDDNVNPRPWIIFEKDVGKVTFNTPNLTTVGEFLFKNHTSLETVDLPGTVTTLKRGAFYVCSSLETVDISKVRNFGESVFYWCKSLDNVVIPEGVTAIPRGLFNMCSGLERISLPGTLVTIGPSSFSGCTKLTLDRLPDSVTTIGDYAFQRCTSLALTRLPSSLVTIGQYAFSEDTGLRELMIPETLTTVGNNAFWQCSRLALVFNNSSLDIVPGSSTYGGIARYANAVVTPAIGIQLVEKKTETTYTPLMMAIPVFVIIGVILAVLAFVGLVRRSGDYTDYDSDYYKV